jgi:ATP-dependent Clp protease ATP-binding subunit ClpC
MSNDKLLDPERIGERAAALQTYLQSTVIGQDSAIETLVTGLSGHFAGIPRTDKPLFNALFLGSTGVGKTWLATKLAENLFHSAASLVRIDCTMLQRSHMTASLIGAPHGYVGFNGDPPLLGLARLNAYRSDLNDYEKTKALPKNVILWDEIDKASPSVHKLLLGILDSGAITLANGDRVCLEHTVHIFTANWGSSEIMKLRDGGFGFYSTSSQANVHAVAEAAAKRELSPEFWGRLDSVVLFNDLTRENAREIVELEIGALQKRVRAGQTPILFSVSKPALEALTDEGYSPKYGARPMKTVIHKRVGSKLANLIASEQVEIGSVVKVGFSEGAYTFRLLEMTMPWEKPLPTPIRISKNPDEPMFLMD